MSFTYKDKRLFSISFELSNSIFRNYIFHLQIGPDPFDEDDEQRKQAKSAGDCAPEKPGLRTEDRQDSGFCEDEEDQQNEPKEDPEHSWMRMVRNQRQRWSSESAVV